MTSEIFSCHLCSKELDTRGKLNKHLKTHTKPYNCQTCTRGFASRLDLQRHIKTQHRAGNEKYPCHVERCSFTSNRKDNLRRHQKKEHTALSCPNQNTDNSNLLDQKSDALGTTQLYNVSNFMRVAASGDLDRLKTFLNAGFTVKTRADDESTALHCSARAGQAEAVRFLLDIGADVEAKNEKSRLPIHEALLSNSFETVELFLEQLPREMSPQMAQELEKYLTRTRSISIVNAYITRLGDAFTNRRVSRKLYFAVRTGHASLLTTLLDNPDVNGNQACVSRYAPIHLAAAFGRTSIMEILIARNDIDKTLHSYGHIQALHIAASKGHIAIVGMLMHHPSVEVSCKDSLATTPLHYAAFNGHWETASLLFTHLESIRDGHRISSDGPPTSLSFAKEDLLHRLFEHPDFGGPNKILSGTHKTILHVAASKGDRKAIEVLLAYPDIDVNKWMGHHGSPLMTAVRNGKLGAVRLLLQHKDIDVNKKTRWRDWTALKWAKAYKHNEIADLLISHGAIDHDAKAQITVPTITHIDNPENTTLQLDDETHFDYFDDDMDDAPTEAWEEFLAMEEGMEE